VKGLKKPDTAFGWYSKAAESSHPKATFNVGVMYENGQSVAQSYDDAMT
jgi:TPR repeat protein